jgi:hypothetical protein
MLKKFIIKADDYGRNGASIEPWRRFFDSVLNRNLAVSVGVVSLELNKNRAVPLYLSALHYEYRFEVWNHSHTHSDFRKLNKNSIVDEVFNSQSIIENLIGVRPSIFGAPFNYIDSKSASVISDTEEFLGYYAFDEFVDKATNIEKKFFCAAEIGTDVHRPVRYEVYKDSIVRRDYPDFLVLQVHPYFWSKSCINDFNMVLDDLLKHGYSSVTARQYVDYHRSKFLPSKEISNMESSSKGVCLDILLAESNVHHNQYNAGVTELSNSFCALGFHTVPVLNGVRKFLDVYGYNNSSVALAMLPASSVVALEKIDTNKATQDACDKLDFNIKYVEDDFLNFFPQENSYSAILIGENLQNVDLVEVFPRVRHNLAYGGSALVSVRNRIYLVSLIFDAIKLKKFDDAKRYIEYFFVNEYCSIGYKFIDFLLMYNSSEVARISISNGIKLSIRDVYSPDSSPLFMGRSRFTRHLLIKTKAAERHMQALTKNQGVNNEAYTSISDFIDKCILFNKIFNILNSGYISFDQLYEIYEKEFGDYGLQQIDKSKFFILFIFFLFLKSGDMAFKYLNNDPSSLMLRMYCSLVNEAFDVTVTLLDDLSDAFSRANETEWSYWV